LKVSLLANAAAAIFTHNHPSGIAEPSMDDLAITKTLTEALRLIDVRVLDHIIVGSDSAYSFAQEGRL
jgi:DNA repair protein RadC